MSGHLRKSAIGSNRKVTAPPDTHHGNPWWTTPPSVMPLDEHIAYAHEFQAQLLGRRPSKREASQHMELVKRVSVWLKAANRLRNTTAVHLGELRSDDEFILAADRVIGALFSAIKRAGGDPGLTADCQAWCDAVRKRANLARESLRPSDVTPERLAAEVAKGSG